MIEKRLIWIRRRHLRPIQVCVCTYFGWVLTTRSRWGRWAEPELYFLLPISEPSVNQHPSNAVYGPSLWYRYSLHSCSIYRSTSTTCRTPSSSLFFWLASICRLFFPGFALVRGSHVPPLVRKTLDQHFNYTRACVSATNFPFCGKASIYVWWKVIARTGIDNISDSRRVLIGQI